MVIDDLVLFLRARLDRDDKYAALLLSISADKSHPQRLLAEIDAKRRIVSAYEEAVAAFDDSGPAFVSYERLTGSVSSLRRAVELLALPYADRPGYREEWKPKPPSP